MNWIIKTKENTNTHTHDAMYWLWTVRHRMPYSNNFYERMLHEIFAYSQQYSELNECSWMWDEMEIMPKWSQFSKHSLWIWIEHRQKHKQKTIDK